ncbi:MAG: hypothetical protein V7K97_23325 [Nostoc sp.]|uniref:hypothetical protein n=1 Tax=Nostoc sp. TaxID=1180 RepID=UPI002FFD494E
MTDESRCLSVLGEWPSKFGVGHYSPLFSHHQIQYFDIDGLLSAVLTVSLGMAKVVLSINFR